MSREAVVTNGKEILLLGGLDAAGATLGTVLGIDPAAGDVVEIGRLAQATHDAAAALIGTSAVVFGGGSATSTDVVQSFGPAFFATRTSPGRLLGRLPGPRSDLSAATVGAATYLVGGWDGSRLQPRILSTTDGSHISAAGTLAVAVRYGAVASADGAVWVFGGQAAAGDVAAIQRFDPVTGHTTIAGRLPNALAGASAVVLDGSIFVLGGSVRGHPTDAIWRFDPTTGTCTPTGRLPRPVAYAGVAAVGGVAYLLGGEGSAMLNTVIRIGVGSS